MPLDVENFFVDGMRPLPQLPSPKNWGEHMMERPSTSNGNEIPRRTPQWRDGPTRQRPSSSNGTELPRRTPKWHDGPERGGGTTRARSAQFCLRRELPYTGVVQFCLRRELPYTRVVQLCLRRELPYTGVVQLCLRRKLPVPGTKRGAILYLCGEY